MARKHVSYPIGPLKLTPIAELAIQLAKDQRKLLIENCPFLTINVNEWSKENLKDQQIEVGTLKL